MRKSTSIELQECSCKFVVEGVRHLARHGVCVASGVSRAHTYTCIHINASVSSEVLLAPERGRLGGEEEPLNALGRLCRNGSEEERGR